jgi:biopolymer transport protein ExbD
MPLKTEQLEVSELNLTPMIDVLFLLIIFFLIGSTFIESERLFEVQVPSVNSAKPLTAAPDQLAININRSGQISLGSKPVTLPQLVTELTLASQRYADQAVVIRGDGEGKYQLVADVLSACHKAHIRNFSVATMLKSE